VSQWCGNHWLKISQQQFETHGGVPMRKIECQNCHYIFFEKAQPDFPLRHLPETDKESGLIEGETGCPNCGGLLKDVTKKK
tara:strand:- start:185 stop:427 length:243 start_codon:yes stop_codon:yes gene_type:complete